MQLVPITELSFDRFAPVLGPAGTARLRRSIAHGRRLLGDRKVWHVNSTASGGGVAEMLQTLLGYERGAGLDVRWIVLEGDEPFFRVTKRLHHRLHGEPGDGGPLGDAERRTYERAIERNVPSVLAAVAPHDVVMLQDPQTAGLAPRLAAAGATVVWRCHIGADQPNRQTRAGWSFLRPYLRHADAYVFSRARYVPGWLDGAPTFVMPPAIDAFAVKNEPLSQRQTRSILQHIGLLAYRPGSVDHSFVRIDGTTGRVHRRAELVQTAPVPHWSCPLIVQVSRWDPLKGMEGVMAGFVRALGHLGNAHLALVGPDVHGVSDDPEGRQVFDACVRAWQRLPRAAQERVHLVCLPMEDVEENAAMVNAIQRHATIVVQKSLREGFGLTVTEAMWKGRAVVASAVGGIQDQIDDGVHGLLLDQPADPTALGGALARLLRDVPLLRRLGRNARRRAVTRFLGPRQTMQTIQLLEAIDGNGRRPARA